MSAGPAGPRYPSLYQLNTRVFLTALASSLGRRATLDDFPDAEIDRLAALGFDWVWLLSVWSTGKASQQRLAVPARAARGVRSDAAGPAGGRHRGLGLRDHRLLGAPGARRRRGARAAPRAPRRARPQADARLRPQPHGARPSLGGEPPGVLRGRDGAGPRARAPQLHVGETQARRPRDGLRARPVLRGLAGHAAARLRESRHARGDGGGAAEDRASVRRRALRHGDAGAAGSVRADLGPPGRAVLAGGRRARARSGPGLPAHGRGLLEPRVDAAAAGLRLRVRQAPLRPTARGRGAARPRALPGRARLPGQARALPREPRRAAGGGDVRAGRAPGRGGAQFLSPGLRFFHAGQLEGCRKKISPHLVRGPVEPVDRELAAFYDQLLGVLRRPAVRDGRWQLLECVPAWDGNASCGRFRGLRLGARSESGCSSQ